MKIFIFCLAMAFGFDCFAASVCIVSSYSTYDNQPAYITVICNDTVAKTIMLAPGYVQDADIVNALAKLVDDGYEIVSQTDSGYYTLVKK